MRPGRRILANFFNLSAGELVARLVNFAAFAHLARVLGSTTFGRIGFVMTIVTYLAIPVLQGFDSVAIRDAARDRSLLARYAANILAIRLVATLAVWGALAAVVRLAAPEPPLGPLLLGFSLTLFATAASVKWAFQAVENTRPVAVAGIFSQLGFAAGALTIARPDQLLRIPLFLLAGEMAGALVLAFWFSRSFGALVPAFDFTLWKRLFRHSAPLLASTVLGALLFNFDVLALAVFQPAGAVGLYTAVYKLVVVFFTPLTLLQVSMLPTLSRACTLHSGVAATAEPALRYLVAAFAPLPFLGLLISPRLLEFLFGAEYAAGSLALQILLFALPLMAQRSLFRIILVSYNLQHLDLRTVAAGTATNVFLDLLLVPRFSIVGAAVSTLCSEFVILGLSHHFVWRDVEKVFLLGQWVRPLMGVAVTMPVAWSLRAAPLALLLAVSAAVYLAALAFLRVISWKEIASR